MLKLMNPALDSRLERARSNLMSRGQTHVLRWWDELDTSQREQLLSDIESIPWPTIDAVFDSLILRAPTPSAMEKLTPAPVMPARPGPDRRHEYISARQRGEELLRGGRIAAFTVAGGQGTRLGVSGPKGMVEVTPIRHKSLFQLFAEMNLAAQRRYQSRIPWYIMTSPANHQATHEYLSANNYFGLSAADVRLFPQGTLPAFDFHGKLLMDDRHRLSLGPDGHGGSLKALVKSGAIAEMKSRGISAISYFQVDNPLVNPFDPLFLGLHDLKQSEMSTKVTPKAHDLEKVGNLCLSGGRLKVIEYSEISEAVARERNPDGSRRFDAANLAIHALDVKFVERIAGQAAGLPLRRAEKAIPFIDEHARRVDPRTPNAVKLETFVFDVLPMAANPLLLEVDRGEEFSPVKNATGPDSLDTSQRDQIARACGWLAQAGLSIPRVIDGAPTARVEISPLFALEAADVKSKRERIPAIHSGIETYLE